MKHWEAPSVFLSISENGYFLNRHYLEGISPAELTLTASCGPVYDSENLTIIRVKIETIDFQEDHYLFKDAPNWTRGGTYTSIEYMNADNTYWNNPVYYPIDWARVGDIGGKVELTLHCEPWKYFAKKTVQLRGEPDLTNLTLESGSVVNGGPAILEFNRFQDTIDHFKEFEQVKIYWSIKGEHGKWIRFETTKHEMYFGFKEQLDPSEDPLHSQEDFIGESTDTLSKSPTPQRVQKVTSLCEGKKKRNESLIKIYDYLRDQSTPPQFDMFAHAFPQDYWTLLNEGQTAQCITIANLMKYMAYVLGILTGYSEHIYAQSEPMATLDFLNPDTYEHLDVDGDGKKDKVMLFMIFNDTPNQGEGCTFFNPYLQEGGIIFAHLGAPALFIDEKELHTVVNKPGIGDWRAKCSRYIHNKLIKDCEMKRKWYIYGGSPGSYYTIKEVENIALLPPIREVPEDYFK